MKKLVISIVIFLFFMSANAQSYDASVDVQRKDQKAMAIDYPYPPNVVEAAIIDRMEKMGYKAKESKGFLVYKGVILSEISSEPADYMIRVERKSRKDKDESVVYLVMNRNDENILARQDALVNSNAKSFLNNITPDVDAYKVEYDIKQQEAAIVKAEKKLKNLIDDQSDMEKKMRKLQDDLKSNAKDQREQENEIEKQKQVLESMKTKRKS